MFRSAYIQYLKYSFRINLPSTYCISLGLHESSFDEHIELVRLAGLLIPSRWLRVSQHTQRDQLTETLHRWDTLEVIEPVQSSTVFGLVAHYIDLVLSVFTAG